MKKRYPNVTQTDILAEFWKEKTEVKNLGNP